MSKGPEGSSGKVQSGYSKLPSWQGLAGAGSEARLKRPVCAMPLSLDFTLRMTENH